MTHIKQNINPIPFPIYIRVPFVVLSMIMVMLFLTNCATSQVPSGSSQSEPTDEPRDIRSGMNEFSRHLYRELVRSGDPESNQVICPVSVYTALAMTYAGAGQTDREKMRRALKLPGPAGKQFPERYGRLLDTLIDVSDGIRMNVANALHVAPDASVSDSYKQILHEHFGARVSALSGEPGRDASEVNRWVHEQTNGMIDRLVTPADLRRALFILLNAVHFQGDWNAPFDRENTREEPFHLANGKTTDVPMMHRTGSYARISLDIGGTAVRLPYGSEERFAMTVFLPDRQQDPVSFFQDVYTASNRRWSSWFEQLGTEKTRLRLGFPRFDLTSGTISLSSTLQKLGFPVQGVNLDRMGIGTIESLRILHKSTITVNEEGTEAAGATGVIGVTSLPPSVTVNRPFFFVIRDRETGTILFQGTVFHPSG